MSLNIDLLVSTMDDAVKDELKSLVTMIPRVHSHHKEIASVIDKILIKSGNHSLSGGKAKIHFMRATKDYRNDLCSVDAFSDEKVDRILGASLESIADLVNASVGFVLIEVEGKDYSGIDLDFV